MNSGSARLVRVAGFPRIHITLIDVANATARQYGGAGFALSGPKIVVSAVEAIESCVTLVLEDRIGSVECKDQVHSMLDRLHERAPYPPVKVTIETAPPLHVGFGTKTSVLLGVAAVNELYNLRLDIPTLKRISGRGGTSGVGINTFFTGGFVTDAGHRQPRTSHLPSSASNPDNIPRVLVQFDFPEDWICHVFLPDGVRRSGSAEIEFFAEHTPIPGPEALDVLAEVYHGLAPAIADADLRGTRRALGRINRIGFKAREVRAQSPDARSLLERLQDVPDLASGMSSMGPLVYALARHDDARSIAHLRQIAQNSGVRLLGSFKGQNSGFEFIQ